MNDLLRALHLIWGYLEDPNTRWPTSCEHDILYVCGVDLNRIPAEDIQKLAVFGFFPGNGNEDILYDPNSRYSDEINFESISQEIWDEIKGELTTCFHSYRFGSC